MIPKKNLLSRLKESTYTRAASIVGIASILLIAGLATISQPKAASADKVEVEEFFGTASVTRTTLTTTDTPLSGCVVLRTHTAAATWIGIIEGGATSVNTTIRDACVGHSSSRAIYKFSSATIKPDPSDPSTWKTGGLVIKTIVQAEFPPHGPTPFKTESQNRILCGTGDLKNIHGEGVSMAPPIGYAVWIHFGHNHDVGFDFLCQDVDDDDS